ncbi:MAG: HEAT repeat domain-containing protein, partial [Myxococcota bacterium]
LAPVVRRGFGANARQATRALGSVEGAKARALLRRTLRRGPHPSLRVAAAAALGEHGRAEDVPLLIDTLDSGPWPLPATAAFALARIARIAGIDAAPDPEALCRAASRSRDPYVRGNLAVVLTLHDGAVCENGPDPARWLEPDHAPAVRTAAARWLAAQAAHGHRDPERAARRLARCAADDPAPHVAQACAEPELPTLGSEVDVYAYSADGTALLADRIIALRLADGTTLVAPTDANGHLRLMEAPHGPLALEDPVSTPMER